MLLDSISCSIMFTQVEESQLTDPKIRVGWGSGFLRALEGARRRAAEDLLCCCLCVILHLLTHASLCARSISAYADKTCACMCKCESMFLCMHVCVSHCLLEKRISRGQKLQCTRLLSKSLE